MNTREIWAQMAHYFRNERHKHTMDCCAPSAMTLSCMHVMFYYLCIVNNRLLSDNDVHACRVNMPFDNKHIYDTYHMYTQCHVCY